MNDTTLGCILQSLEIPLAQVKPIKENLYFKRSNGTYLLIQEAIDEDKALTIISNFLNRHNYTSYYTRYWREDGKTIYDVGSWSEFFVLAAADKIPADKVVGTEKDFVDKVKSPSIVEIDHGREVAELVSSMYPDKKKYL